MRAHMTYSVRAISTIDSEQFSSIEFRCSGEELPAKLAGLADMFFCDGGMIGIQKVEVRDGHPGKNPGDAEHAGGSGAEPE